jgi:hypothetical protein
MNAIREEGFLIDDGPCVWHQESYEEHVLNLNLLEPWRNELKRAGSS